MAASPAARRWAAIIVDQSESGQSVREYAHEHGLNPSTLSWWRWELARRERGSVPRFVELTVVPAVDDPPHTAAPVVVDLVAVGARVKVYPDTDLALLRRVLEALC